MIHTIRLCILLLLCSSALHAQTFTVVASPSMGMVVEGDTATFAISAIPAGGFDASVYLSASSPTLIAARFQLDIVRLNVPYPTATLRVLTAGGAVGTHEIIIEGRNGGFAVYDTVSLQVAAHSYSFTVAASPDTRSVREGDTATFMVSVKPGENFDASVFLGAASPTLDAARLRFDLTKINSPYSQAARLRVVSKAGDEGEHSIIVKGWNGTFEVYDTVVLKVTRKPGPDGWTTYGLTKTGLPTSTVRAIAFDRTDTAWIGTDSGLVRIAPGGEMSRESDILDKNTSVLAIAVDSGGGVWVATEFPSRLLSYRNGVWTDHLNSNSYYPIRFLAITADTTVWGATEAGLIRVRDDEVMVFTTENSGLTSNYIDDVVVTSSGDLWASFGNSGGQSDAGLARFKGAFWTVYSMAELGVPDGSYYFKLAVDSADRIWMSAGLDIVIVDGPGISHLRLPNPVHVAFGPTGIAWAITNISGRPVLLEKQEGATWKRYNDDQSGAAPGTLFARLATHRDGSVWIGTVENGVMVYRPSTETTGLRSMADRSATASSLEAVGNPLHGEGRMQISTSGGRARLGLYDNIGRTVARIFDGRVEAGTRMLPFDLGGVRHGAYLLVLEVDGITVASRMVMVAN